MAKNITLTLDETHALVLFDFLSSQLDFPKEGNKKFDLSNPDFAEKVALAKLLSMFEPKIDVVFGKDYERYLEAAKVELTKGYTKEVWEEE